MQSDLSPQAGRGDLRRRLARSNPLPSIATNHRAAYPPGAFRMDWIWYLFRFDGRINRACCGRRC